MPEEIIGRVKIEAAHLTASSMNGQPWHFIVVDDRETLVKLGAAAIHGPYIAGCAFAVVVAINGSRYAVSDGSRAVQSMVLTAWADGVGSNWVGFAGGLTEAKPIVGLSDDFDILTIVPFGYPARQIGAGIKKRKPLAEIASRGRFGQPFA